MAMSVEEYDTAMSYGLPRSAAERETMHPRSRAAIETVIAEDAPIGVQLWPTTDPQYAPNFTLMEVRTVRTATRSYVRWVYENGSERTFDLGEMVAVRIHTA
jgi:hypothetical protein